MEANTLTSVVMLVEQTAASGEFSTIGITNGIVGPVFFWSRRVDSRAKSWLQKKIQGNDTNDTMRELTTG